MALTPSDWHLRFAQQARWTQDLRRYLFERAGLRNAARVLEVGCGTGALLAGLGEDHGIPGGAGKIKPHGLDIAAHHLAFAHHFAPRALLTQGDAHTMPYSTGSFDLSFCHFLLLWVRQPESVVAEMARLTRPGGAVLALAEPDYGGRIDYPFELAQLASLQQAALQRQGADPLIGRRLAAIFSCAGLKQIETGVLGGQWHGPPCAEEWENEWRVLLDDLQDSLPQPDLERLRALDEQAWRSGQRVLFVPTFYAWGRVER